MKKLFFSLMVMTLAMAGCGSGSVSWDVPVYPPIVSAPYPPSITSYDFSKDRDKYFIVGNIQFYAPDSDIDTMTVNVFDSRGSSVYKTKNVINRRGITNGSIPFSVDYINFANDTYTFSVYVTDFNGNYSNQVVDTFRVP